MAETGLNKHPVWGKPIAFVRNATIFFSFAVHQRSGLFSRRRETPEAGSSLVPRRRPQSLKFFFRNKAFQEMFILVCQLFLILRFCCQHGPEIRSEVKRFFNLVLLFIDAFLAMLDTLVVI